MSRKSYVGQKHSNSFIRLAVFGLCGDAELNALVCDRCDALPFATDFGLDMVREV